MSLSWRSIVVPGIVVGAWELATGFRVVDFDFISRPSRILIAGISGLTDGSFLYATWQTLEACLFGIAIALVVGVLLGIFFGLSRFAELISRPSLEGLRSIPAIAFAPLSLLLFGFGLS
jgi:ABC-type nitrate/sulfonate/bicarbonate transport system permease component